VNVLPDNLTENDLVWMKSAAAAATSSPDKHRKTGVALISSSGKLISAVCNTFPDGLEATEERLQRPCKYIWLEHAERLAIFEAAEKGISTRGSTMYLNWYPCVACTRAIIHCGCSAIVAIEPDWNDPIYGDDFAFSRQMLAEKGISVRFAEGLPPSPGP
jgi:dCMP deaminase